MSKVECPAELLLSTKFSWNVHHPQVVRPRKSWKNSARAVNFAVQWLHPFAPLLCSSQVSEKQSQASEWTFILAFSPFYPLDPSELASRAHVNIVGSIFNVNVCSLSNEWGGDGGGEEESTSIHRAALSGLFIRQKKHPEKSKKVFFGHGHLEERTEMKNFPYKNVHDCYIIPPRCVLCCPPPTRLFMDTLETDGKKDEKRGPSWVFGSLGSRNFLEKPRKPRVAIFLLLKILRFIRSLGN